MVVRYTFGSNFDWFIILQVLFALLFLYLVGRSFTYWYVVKVKKGGLSREMRNLEKKALKEMEVQKLKKPIKKTKPGLEKY